MGKQYFGRMSKMFLYFCVFFYFMLNSCSSNYAKDVVIEKRQNFSGTLSFPSYDYLIQRLYFHNDKQIYNVNYALNGWQIIDSSAINYKDNKVCQVVFYPKYNSLNRYLEDYRYADSSCREDIDSFQIFNRLNDKYRLSKGYVKNIISLLYMEPKVFTEGYTFEGGVIPFLFFEYSIPREELLNSFKFEIINNLIQNDSFNFENYLLIREYEYDEHKMLKSITIHVKNKSDQSQVVFKEYFTIQ